ncbi:MAG: glycosyltransferase family 2 protein, partial [bacterium]|nr:glycosyltransferase family 2 protein [bacterium]
MSNPKVSICMPAYNQPEFLRLVLESIVGQDFKDFELIISDDSTNDESTKVVDAYRSRIQSLIYFKNTPSKGSPQSWNEAITHGKGSYIKVMHNDDWFSSPSSLTKFVKMLDEHPESDFAFCATYICGPDQKILKTQTASSQELEKLKDSATYLFGRNIIGAPSVTMFRNTVKNKYYDPQMKWVVDVDQYVAILEENPHFQYCTEPLVSTTDGALHQSSHSSVGLKNVELYEWLRLYSKSRKRHKNIKYRYFMWLYILFVLD